MNFAKLLKWCCWGFTLVHLVGSVMICVIARHLNEPDSKQHGIFSYKATRSNPPEARSHRPHRRHWGRSYKVVSVATQAVGAASNVAGAVETKAADLFSKLKVELDVGTENVNLQVGGDTHQLWPPETSSGDGPHLPKLPGNLDTAVNGLIEKFKAATSVSLELIADLAIGFSFVSTLTYIGVALMPRSCWCCPCGVLGSITGLSIGLLSNGSACIILFALHWFFDGVLEMGSKLPSVDTGAAVHNALLSFRISAAQCGLSMLLCLLFILQKCFGRQTQRKKSGDDDSQTLPPSSEMKQPYQHESTSHQTMPHHDIPYSEDVPPIPSRRFSEASTLVERSSDQTRPGVWPNSMSPAKDGSNDLGKNPYSH